MTGDAAALGSWEPREGLKMQWTEGDVWVGELEVECGQKLEYKYVTRNKQGQPQEWQGGANMFVIPPVEAGTCDVRDTWDGKSVVTITSLYEPPALTDDPLESLVAGWAQPSDDSSASTDAYAVDTAGLEPETIMYTFPAAAAQEALQEQQAPVVQDEVPAEDDVSRKAREKLIARIAAAQKRAEEETLKMAKQLAEAEAAMEAAQAAAEAAEALTAVSAAAAAVSPSPGPRVYDNSVTYGGYTVAPGTIGSGGGMGRGGTGGISLTPAGADVIGRVTNSLPSRPDGLIRSQAAAAANDRKSSSSGADSGSSVANSNGHHSATSESAPPLSAVSSMDLDAQESEDSTTTVTTTTATTEQDAQTYQPQQQDGGSGVNGGWAGVGGGAGAAAGVSAPPPPAGAKWGALRAGSPSPRYAPASAAGSAPGSRTAQGSRGGSPQAGTPVGIRSNMGMGMPGAGEDSSVGIDDTHAQPGLPLEGANGSRGAVHRARAQSRSRSPPPPPPTAPGGAISGVHANAVLSGSYSGGVVGVHSGGVGEGVGSAVVPVTTSTGGVTTLQDYAPVYQAAIMTSRAPRLRRVVLTAEGNTRSHLGSLTVGELRHELTRRALPLNGSHAELIQRLVQAGMEW